MMKKNFLLTLIVLLFSTELFAAPPAWAFRVRFKDKVGTLTFADSLQYLSPKALSRRANQNISLDSSDLPVVPSYITQVMTAGAAVKLHNVSKWFNQIVVITTDSSKVTDIAALSMVESVKLVATYPTGIYKTSGTPQPDKFPKTEPLNMNMKKTRGSSVYYGLTFQQVDILQCDYLHDLGYKGQGMDIAVFDVNFRYVNTCGAFNTLITDNRVKDVHNFARDTNYVYSLAINSSHGMNVLGCMASDLPGTNVGTAPMANYFLYITEDILSEQPIEEDNWLSAAERADSIGVDLINSSLGYNVFTEFPSASYTYASMDGQTSLIALAANKAVTKGIFVVNAQGNDGANPWHYLITPADADSVYSVGSIDGSGNWANSGYGPTYDQRIKPDGLAMGRATLLVDASCAPVTANGSSFASPILCGAIACLWQSDPTLTASQLRRLVRMCSDRYNNPNNTHGYGIPNFELAHSIVLGTADVTNIDYSFSLYPNPSNGKFWVNAYDDAIDNIAYSLYDMQGKLLYQSEQLNNANFQSDVLESAANGEYLLKITTSNKTFSTKVIKK